MGKQAPLTITLDAARRLRMTGDWWTVHVPGLAYTVDVRIGQHADGRLGITGLAVGADAPADVTARSLRQIPVTALLEQLERIRDRTPALDELFGRAPALERPDPRGRRGIPAEFYAQVAEVYRRAAAQTPAGRSPLRAFRRRFADAKGRTISEATARRWIQRARDMRLLVAAKEG
jgi:hypothetical protein